MRLLSLGSQECFLDLGAYNGDTIREFLRLTDGQYAWITAMEPDAHNFKKLCEATSLLPNVTLRPEASWDKTCELTFSGKGGRNCGKKPDLPGKYTHLHSVPAIPVDSLNQEFTYVKMDVEGSEAETLRGMQNTLHRCRPKLLISAYHKTDDFIALPLLLEQLCPGYQMYLRRNRCLPAWEIQLYCV
jgi:FkbM family methyltransferase